MASTRHESNVVLDRRKLMRELRRRGHSAATFALVAGISAGTLSSILHRGKPITPRTARKIGEALTRIPAIDGLDGIMQAVDED
jgi:lambda repressor-like predicted transcriptional regulator